jgi:hypothetical protein
LGCLFCFLPLLTSHRLALNCWLGFTSSSSCLLVGSYLSPEEYNTVAGGKERKKGGGVNREDIAVL